LATVVTLAAPRAARADGLDGQKYVPAAGAAGGFAVEHTLIPSHLDWGMGLMLHYADDPVVVKDSASADDPAKPLHEALPMDLLPSIGLWDVAEFAVHLPVDLIWSGDDTMIGGDLYSASAGVGDLRLVPKIEFVRTREFGLGVAIPLRLPTGD